MLAYSRQPAQPAAPAQQAPEQAPDVEAEAAGDVQAQFDTPTHVGIGDSVDGTSVMINGVAFTPGEIAALVDFVGSATNLNDFDADTLTAMRQLIRDGVEDAYTWDKVTGGMYSELAQDNEPHFAGKNGFGTTFVATFTQALTLAQQAQSYDEGSPEHEVTMNDARLQAYTAEHFLEDAFSAGHYANTDVIGEKVDALVSLPTDAWMFPLIAEEVFQREPDVISQYGWAEPHLDGTVTYNPIDTATEFAVIGGIGGGSKLVDGLKDGTRKFVHEQLAKSGVEVTSGAHPEPWVLRGDHDLDDSDESVSALQAAIAASREALEHVVAGTDPGAIAAELFAFHAPQPTEQGQATVDEATDAATVTHLALVQSVAEGTAATIVDVMETACAMTKGLLARIGDVPGIGEGKPRPEFPHYDGGEGEDDGPSVDDPGAPIELDPGVGEEEPEVGIPERGDPSWAQPIEPNPVRGRPVDGRRPRHQPREGKPKHGNRHHRDDPPRRRRHHRG